MNKFDGSELEKRDLLASGEQELNYLDFPVGCRVAVKRCIADFQGFSGKETGVVVRNSGRYYGIVVQFEQNIRVGDKKSSYRLEQWNFKPIQLVKLDNPHPVNV